MKKASNATRIVTDKDMISPIPKILEMTLLSFLPQYWEAKMVSAEFSPKNNTYNKNITCPAKLDAEMDV
jgi:hypothetical protein